MKLGLVIPVFNEAAGLAHFIDSWKSVDLEQHQIAGIWWVNNGSTDGSDQLLQHEPHLVSLETNQGYGGGVKAGILNVDASCTHVAWIPADGQIPIEAVLRVWEAARQDPAALHKGNRVERFDGFTARFVSETYSLLVRWLLGVNARDVNGLPKIAPRAFMQKAAKQSTETTFTWDASVLKLAKQVGLRVVEHPVSFLKRSSGVSSWSGRRIRTYFQVLGRLFLME